PEARLMPLRNPMRPFVLAVTSTLVVAGLVTAALPTKAVNPSDWPQFRGQNCSGISRETAPLPAKLSSTEGVKWSTELPDGIGSPIVVDGRVYTSAIINPPKPLADPFAEPKPEEDKPKEETPAPTGPTTVVLFAFDAATGEKLWERTWETGE